MPDEARCAVVTGAGSGVGQAVAVALASQGWRVALIGRRKQRLDQTVALMSGGATTLVCPADIASRDEVGALADRVRAELGAPEVLVNAAGLNTPERALRNLSDADYRLVIGANMDGAYYCVQAFLPGMREHRRGTIVNVASIAGLRASALAGTAYAMSKFGMVGLTQAINAEERGNGIRACVVCPGDIDTPLLDYRPVVPGADARARMLRPEDVARCVVLAIELPQHAVIEELTISPL